MAEPDAWVQTSQGTAWWAQREPLPLRKEIVGSLEMVPWQGPGREMGGDGTKRHGQVEREHYSLLFTTPEQGMTGTIMKAGLKSQVRVTPPN